ncbi:uncharacterized protein LOC116337915 isoform X2 [Contarinia nasturtii]|uniref:uncharacterized protein LOC116337915 isoform X2 n=1 Tax=Contarinia nasturtii TaxID=265458 RepID=UPI0012D41D65|nr:uncharacterized protein LOC116337915 isoform X2 [Contarinia nasturtii]
MNRLYYLWILFMAAIFVQRVLSVPSAATDVPDDEDEDDFDDSEESAEADDDGRIYKNPRNSPSSDCPRDEEQATLLGQKCLRKCSSHEDCKSKKKKCLCDGTCGMSCIKPDRECPELPQPELGTVTLSGREFGGKAVYTCPLGYNVVGLAERLCRNGQWTGSQPICSKNIFCLTPPVIEHARHSALPEQATFELDSAVQYHCYTGYVTAGFPRAKCLAIDGHASWYGPDINCEPRSCGQPTDPTHGWHAGECYTFGCRITYHCGEGYELVGKSERFCQATGDWSPKEMPTCVLVTSVVCPIPESPKNGKAIYTSLSYNSIVSYECRYGYTLVNDSSRRCGADRKWSGSLPTCKEINCGSPGVLFNGWLENIDAGTGLGASIIFRCQPGMLLAGNTSTVCQVDGRWRYPVPECLAPCVIPTVQQGTVIAMEKELDPNATTPVTPTLPPTSNQVIHGTTLEVVCEDRYEFPIISSAPPTCMNGTWSIIPRCTPARCKTLPKPPKFGMVLAPKTEHGMKARFKCKDGFKLTGPDGKEVIDENEYVRTCAFGNWTGLTPMCQELFCAFPGYVEHGKVLLIGNMGLYDYRPYVRKIMNNKQIMYDCDKGYILNEKGPVGATCVGGVWRPTELPECSPGLHPRLRWNRRKRAAKIEQKHKILRNFGRFKREISEVLRRNAVIEDPFPLRQKRSLLHHRGGQRKIHRRIIPNHNINHKWHLVAPAIMRFKRNIARKRYPEIDYQFVRPLRNEFQQQQQRIRFEEAQRRAYNKYYEKIRQKHRNYINNLLRASHSQRVIDDDEPLVFDNKGDPYADDDDYKTPAQDPFDEINAYASMPIPLPNINEDRNIYAKKEINDGIVNNTFVGRSHSDAVHDENGQIGNRNYLPQISRQHEKNVSDIVNLLQSQIVRRRKRILLGSKGVHNNGKLFHRVKRAPRAPKKSEDPIEEDGNGSDTEGSRKSKTKEPCEPIAMKPYIRIDIVREGRDPSNEFGTGTIIRATCAKEYRLNLQNPNGTAKCVRGRWKPLKPECTLVPCSIASTAHGAYVALVVDQKDDNGKTTMQPLNAFDEVQSGEIVQVNCDEGYTVQGPNRLKCQEGSWDVNGLPECVPAPCSLPNISNAVYQEGYRGGLTIAHAASVSVQCEGSEETVQMKCSLGNLTPQTVQCQPAQISAIAKKTRESEYLGEVDFFSSNQDVTSILTGFNKINEKFGKSKILNMKTENSGSYYQHTFGEGKPCGMPTRVEETILYKNGEPVTDADEGFESGTEITFNCIKGAAGERTTWKIVCEDGTWNGRSFDCTNGTCIFYNDEPNVVSFYNDLRIDEGVVEFPPGATIVSRNSDKTTEYSDKDLVRCMLANITINSILD